MAAEAREIIRRPILTEKSLRGTELGKYTFEVAPGADKIAIRQAVERLFNVRVVRVNVVNLPGRQKRRGQHVYRAPGRRKAVVTLAPGEKIDLESLT
ncbi:MAG: 50S ribosomal protein L23 [Armatimonadota bacterium]|nr:50S ribosomal protein L23 [Armatimonadota bacterium]MDR7449498.1 50S ribosomal protein L23 [Armatimonadota bacterium]MDR7459971.1 50S ribosomal protein L23 [Armatimonadota bacterium]MDR7480696.1 50S ribosomal protein L23 [Armatimonadota bacterium]MDR7489696.1 50S ribosomal protein L23 [Armatimonadota bacterium]